MLRPSLNKPQVLARTPWLASLRSEGPGPRRQGIFVGEGPIAALSFAPHDRCQPAHAVRSLGRSLPGHRHNPLSLSPVHGRCPARPGWGWPTAPPLPNDIKKRKRRPLALRDATSGGPSAGATVSDAFSPGRPSRWQAGETLWSARPTACPSLRQADSGLLVVSSRSPIRTCPRRPHGCLLGRARQVGTCLAWY